MSDDDRLDALESELGELREQVRAIGRRVGDIETKLGTVEQDAMDGYEAKQAVDDLERRVRDLEDAAEES